MNTATVTAAILLCLISINPLPAQELTGDTKLACEAILCLSSSARPDECNPSLKRYYGISKKKWSDTVKARKNFLNLCPTASTDSKMQSLVNAMASGAGRCEATSLNLTLSSGDEYNSLISNRMPDYCSIYYNHEYTDLIDTMPVYVGSPSTGGFWTTKEQYQNALNQYNRQLQNRWYGD
jgi:TrbM.